MSNPFVDLSYEPECEYTGKLLKHVRFLSSPKDSAFITVEDSINNDLYKINIYFNNERVRGMRISKTDRIMFACYEIFTGLATDKGLLGTAISDYDVKTNYRGNARDMKRWQQLESNYQLSK